MYGNGRYQLRACAGKYWLLDMKQPDHSYRAPIAMNETGALILKAYWETGDIGRTAAVLEETFEIGREEAWKDVSDFLDMLHLED